MGFTEIIMWIIAIVIVLVLADAIRKILLEKRSNLKVKIDPRFRDLKEEMPDNNILGKPRSRHRDVIEQLELGSMEPPLMMDADDGVDAAANYDELPDPVIRDEADEPAAETPPEDAVPSTAQDELQVADLPEDEVTATEVADTASSEAKPAPVVVPAKAVPAKTVVPQAPAKATEMPAAKHDKPQDNILDVIVVHLLFPLAVEGDALLQALLEQGLRYGEMKIFHAHKGNNLLFSMANAHEPGYFNIDQMEKQQFKAVSFFVRLPGPQEPLAALNRMLDAAQQLATQFDGELKDENRISLSQQRMEHMREKVQEFERRQRVGDANRH